MKLRVLGRIVLGIVVGEIVLIFGTAFVQEVLFDGISFVDSTRFVLLVGGLLTVLAAVLAGYVARRCLDSNLLVPSFISLLVAVETYYLNITGITPGPIWFDALAGIGLIVGIWLGYTIKNQALKSQII